MSNIVLLSVQEVADKLKVTPQYVRKLISENKLKAKRVGSQWVVENEAYHDFIKEYDFCIEPDDHKRESDSVPSIVALSFFSGAMGLDIGMSKGGIDAILACEFNKYCRMTIQKNRPDMALIGDINKYSAEEILQMANLPKGTKIDVIFGGPPCQAFSTAGARRGFDDDRGNVFLRYIEIVEALKPTYVVIENVRGLLSAPYYYGDIEEPIKGAAFYLILEKLEKIGYSISFELYNAANFGAPQIRERVVIIGKLGNNKVAHLTPSHSDDKRFCLKDWKTLGEAIADVENEPQHFIEFPEKRLKYYRLLKEGQYWKDLPLNLQREAMGAKLELGGGKTGFYRRLSFNKPSPTLVTNPTMPATDLCHPTENRPLSVEEYSCIQGFPRDWTICGPILEQYKQIGNAVPIKLGEEIARTIIRDMQGIPSVPIKDFPYSRYKNTNEIIWREQMEDEIKKRTKPKFEQLLFDFA